MSLSKYSRLGPGRPIGRVEFIREGWAIDLSSESSYSVSFPTDVGMQWSLHVSKRPYLHAQVWLKEAQHDNSRSGEQRSVSSMKGQAAITNVKDGKETADTHESPSGSSIALGKHCGAAALSPRPAARVGSRGDLPMVASVDLSRYVGTWYKIARLPMWFQRHRVDSKATYSPS